MNKLVAAAQTDTNAEKKGAWVEYSPDGQSKFHLLLARAGTSNPAFMKKQEELTRAHRRAGKDLNTLDPEAQRAITRELYAHTVLLGWKEEQVGEPYTPEAAVRIFEQANDVLDFCVVYAQQSDTFRKAAIGEVAGN